ILDLESEVIEAVRLAFGLVLEQRQRDVPVGHVDRLAARGALGRQPRHLECLLVEFGQTLGFERDDREMTDFRPLSHCKTPRCAASPKWEADCARGHAVILQRARYHKRRLLLISGCHIRLHISVAARAMETTTGPGGPGPVLSCAYPVGKPVPTFP